VSTAAESSTNAFTALVALTANSQYSWSQPPLLSMSSRVTNANG
jgi:hypothetical protein